MQSALTYLRLKLTPGMEKTIQTNISSLQNWPKMNKSLLGEINLVKCSALQRFILFHISYL